MDNKHQTQGNVHRMLFLFSCPIMSDSLGPCGLRHTRPPCPSPCPGVCPSSCPLNRWCHSTILSSVTLLSFCLQSSLASESFAKKVQILSWTLSNHTPQTPAPPKSFLSRTLKSNDQITTFLFPDWWPTIGIVGRTIFLNSPSHFVSRSPSSLECYTPKVIPA